MARRSAIFRSFAVIATTFLVASCDQARDSESPLAPATPSFSQGSSGGNSGPGSGNSGPGSGLQDLLGANKTKEVKLITEAWAPVEQKLSKLIGMSGGTISLLGHTLTVEPGTVTIPTLFTLTALPTPEIDVLVTATVTDVLGGVLDVGELGFKRPVTLTLTYYRAYNVDDPKRLVLVYFNPNGKLEVLDSNVDYKRYTVSAKLKHFSKYGMASN